MVNKIQVKSTLFKQTKTGAIQEWKVFVEGNEITVQQGQVDGLKQSYSTFCEGKNIGRSNETTPEEQALSEAESKWNKQIKKGYTEDPSGKIQVKLPQKVKEYFGNEKSVVFPCSGSPKLDGVNGTFWLKEGTLSLKSRGGEDYPIPPQIGRDALDFMSQHSLDCLNGEIYCHGMHLQDITSAVKKHNNNTPLLKFYVFEFPTQNYNWEEKHKWFSELCTYCHGTVEFVNTVLLNNHEEVLKHHDNCVASGYEGSILRNLKGVYKFNERSSDVFKVKVDRDAEFKIVDYKVDKNNQVVFNCLTPEGLTFNVKPKGTKEERAKILEEVDDWIGGWLKVGFENYSKDMKPLKPKGLGLRKCNDKGEPLE